MIASGNGVVRLAAEMFRRSHAYELEAPALPDSLLEASLSGQGREFLEAEHLHRSGNERCKD